MTGAATATAWRRGLLAWKLNDHEKGLYDFIRSGAGAVSVAHCPRGFGKTKCIATVALEIMQREPGAILYYIAPNQRQAKKILTPLVQWLALNAPDDCRPEWHHSESGIVTPNGSKLWVYGTDAKQYDNARGQTIQHYAFVDEAAFCADLDIMVRDVLGPACRKGGGRIVMVSTSPESTDHPFRDMAEAARAEGRYFRRTILDNTSWGEPERKAAADECGGVETATYRREYMSEFCQDERRAVIPEWTADVEAQCFRPVEVPEYYCSCGSLDPGTKDHTGYVCGYYDFRTGEYVITGEYFAAGVTTADIANGVKIAEAGIRIDRRVSDTDLQVILDIRKLHGMDIGPVKKDNKQAMVNHLRMIVKAGKLVISESCPITCRQVRTAMWETTRDDWKRTERNGHFDCLAALIYFARSVDVATNPWPVVPAGMRWVDYHTHSKRKPGEAAGMDDGWEKLAEVM
jgi:hypothetical protein